MIERCSWLQLKLSSSTNAYAPTPTQPGSWIYTSAGYGRLIKLIPFRGAGRLPVRPGSCMERAIVSHN